MEIGDIIRNLIEERKAKLIEEKQYLDLKTHDGLVKHLENNLNIAITVRNEIKEQHDNIVEEINFLNKMLDKFNELESENENEGIVE